MKKREIFHLDNGHDELRENAIATDAEVRRRSASDWISLCAYFRVRGESDGYLSMKQFADEMDISYTAMRKANSRYDVAIKNYIDARGGKVPKPRYITQIEAQRGNLINTFRRSYVKHDISTRNKSEKWFNKVRKDVISGQRVPASRLKVGRLYTYMYDAKTKDRLPYWDVFPLIIYLGSYRAKNGNVVFNGLNLHYIPPSARQAFMEELLTIYSSTKSISKTTRLMIDWASVKGMRGADLMIKSYLFPQQLRSQITEIEPSEWMSVIHMPLQKFVMGGGGGGGSFSASKAYSQY